MGVVGRPTVFKDEFVEQAEKLCMLGATDDEIANFFNVSTRTVYRWKNENERFCQALKVGKEAADNRVERSLYQRALGYTHDEEKIFLHEGEAVRVDTVKHYPPDTTAGIFWLKNRRSQEWRDKQEVEVTGNFAEQLAARRKKRLANRD